MTKRIFRSICIVAFSVLSACLLLIISTFYSYLSDVQISRLEMQAELAAQGVENEGMAYFEGLDTSAFRITLIDRDGSILYDSIHNSDEMENHYDREEIREALENGIGESTRYSETSSRRYNYFAKRLENGTVIRISVPQSNIWLLLAGSVPVISAITVFAVILSLILAYRLSRVIVKPLNKLDLEHPLDNADYDELVPLLQRIDSQQKQLKSQQEKLDRAREELVQVVGSMNEGLVLLNFKGEVLIINSAADYVLAQFGIDISNGFNALNEIFDTENILKFVEKGEKYESTVELKNRIYQFNWSPVSSDGVISGIVVLIFDITEKAGAEQLRREFSSNVSHELKTPLQSISGYAELLSHGMVREEDTQNFALNIYSESQRMIRLIEDIIHLSHLDEGADDMSYERINLYTVVLEIAERLRVSAKNSEIELKAEGENAFVWGIPQLVQGIVYNLCDNAIKYNKKNGKVNISVKREEDFTILEVQDTGIGIAPEHQQRIFERFYRVDKSHSKLLGGTGLGLSIVKHAVIVMGAEIALSSTPDIGTCVTVKFKDK